jgi:hypothetical protein
MPQTAATKFDQVCSFSFVQAGTWVALFSRGGTPNPKPVENYIVCGKIMFTDFNSQMQDEDEALALAIARSMEDQTSAEEGVSLWHPNSEMEQR